MGVHAPKARLVKRTIIVFALVDVVIFTLFDLLQCLEAVRTTHDGLKWLKDEVIANVLHKDQNDIDQSITRFEQYVLQHPDEVLRRIGCAA
ncbi:hypothetical protein [Geobacillus sp. ZGt-1]|uniref:hypothetical protein n=1 Tax=Geobacillus sp. ZGt-1 TaxID=1631556 RepID=UPI001F47641B|nr:hypothetical protein [Geobacillus sp. ZGt-1]